MKIKPFKCVKGQESRVYIGGDRSSGNDSRSSNNNKQWARMTLAWVIMTITLPPNNNNRLPFTPQLAITSIV